MKKFILPITILILISLTLVIKFFIPSEKINKDIACTEEAKICPDGTAVGRSGVNCEFLPCPEPKEQNNVTFSCEENKSINAIFNNGVNNSVSLKLSDGRQINLPIAISASGARYATPDESVVFWNKGETAFIEENAKISFSNCILNK